MPSTTHRVGPFEATVSTVSDQAIAERAYDKALARGSTSGLEPQDWRAAEAELIAEEKRKDIPSSEPQRSEPRF